MKRNPLTLLTGLVLAGIFALLLFVFQVRQTEVAVVTTFGQYSRSLKEPGAYLRWPWPIQSVYKFDNRIQNLERKFEQTSTKDQRNLMITVYAGWRIADPELFLKRFSGGVITKAEETLEGLLRDTKQGVIGQHPLSDLISPNANEVKFDDIEQEMLDRIRPAASKDYGIEVALLGIKQLGLPESITGKVFERMRAERQRQAKAFLSEGDSKAIEIKALAEAERKRILSDAESEATRILGQADAEAAKHYAVFERNPKLAIDLFSLQALEQALKERSTLILDQNTPPFNMLRGSGSELPGSDKQK
ncbi:MAG: protease modulator HflC [Verrucomicrobia bacterium]|nr:protease modulator HflC [Verrucomicrobiota bacterium]